MPYSYTLHGPTELFEPMRWRIDLKIARAEFVSRISHFAGSQAMLFSDPAHWPKLRIVHCGVEPERYRSSAQDPQAGLRLLFVGRLAAIKGLRVLFDALLAPVPTIPICRSRSSVTDRSVPMPRRRPRALVGSR